VMWGPIGVVAVIAYFVGSIPFGWLLTKALKGVDLRTLGSGNIGATNAGRILGKKWGIIVLALDAAKGLLPVLLLPQAVGDLFSANSNSPTNGHLPVVAGMAAILGHMFPCWLAFRGGKGVATALGVVSCLAPYGTLAAFAVFLLTFAITRIVSLGSILAAVTFALFQMVWLQPAPFSGNQWSLGVFSLAIPLLVILRHRANLLRLVRGEEAKFRSNPPETPQSLT